MPDSAEKGLWKNVRAFFHSSFHFSPSSRMFTRKTYLAAVLLAGIVVKFLVTAPDRRRAMEEVEGMIDDCGFLLDFSEE